MPVQAETFSRAYRQPGRKIGSILVNACLNLNLGQRQTDQIHLLSEIQVKSRQPSHHNLPPRHLVRRFV
jgi:hypothetical protein